MVIERVAFVRLFGWGVHVAEDVASLKARVNCRFADTRTGRGRDWLEGAADVALVGADRGVDRIMV